MNPFYMLIGLSNQRMLGRTSGYCRQSNDYSLGCALGVPNLTPPNPCPSIDFSSLNGTILVVGGCGYVGSNAISFFYNNCPNVKLVSMDNLSGVGAAETNIPLSIRSDTNRYAFIQASMQDSVAVTNILSASYFGSNKIDTIIHLAAYLPWQPGLDLDDFVQNNVTNTRAFLDACEPFCISGQVKHIIYQNTMMSYICAGNSIGTNPYINLDYINSDYAISKSWAASLMLNYSKTMPISTVFPGHVFGGINQHQYDLFYLVQNTITAGQKVQLPIKYTTHYDAWIHVDDLSKWYGILLLEGANYKKVRLVNPTQRFTTYDTVSKIIRQLTGTSNPDNYITFTSGEITLPLINDFTVNGDMNLCYVPALTLDAEIASMPLP